MSQVWKAAAWAGLLTLAVKAPPLLAQATPTAAVEPIYWRQNLLTVPYQWSTTGGTQTSKTVWLYVSKDRGTSWQLVADAQSHLLSFNYRAEADGEYWFAVRTTESRDAQMPSSMQSVAALVPELKVIVDTAAPKVESLAAQLSGASSLEVRWRITDANLGTQSCVVEAQLGPAGDWQPVPLRSEAQVSAGIWAGTAALILPAGSSATSVRATVIDLANNRSRFQTPVGTDGQLSPQGGPMLSTDGAVQFTPAAVGEPGWTSGSAPSIVTNQFAAPAKPQLWPADRSGQIASHESGRGSASVAYGTPINIDPRDESQAVPETELRLPQPTTEDRPLGNIPPPQHVMASPPDLFRSASLTRTRGGTDTTRTLSDFQALPPPMNPLARRVNSRSFALEYELADVGEQGVAKVEAWGTHDGGQTWQSYAVDDDNRSPLQVTVDGEGEYGFSIVVADASAEAGVPPKPGDTPALWVEVDLEPPIARILEVNAARGQTGGELNVSWEAEDDHLEPRPIALFYSSRPAGPWTPIATSVENVGDFTWPIERHVPRRIYLKLEVRDAAGNVAAFQTAEPVVTESEPAVAEWQRLPPVR